MGDFRLMDTWTQPARPSCNHALAKACRAGESLGKRSTAENNLSNWGFLGLSSSCVPGSTGTRSHVYCFSSGRLRGQGLVLQFAISQIGRLATVTSCRHQKAQKYDV